MSRLHWIVMFAVAALGLTSCGGNPLVGSWQAPLPAGSGMAVLHLNADGTVTVTATGGTGCTGSLQYAGSTWTSTDTTITYSGNPSCTGSVMCTFAGITNSVGCAQSTSGTQNGACTYLLSNNGESLTLSSCSGSSTGSTTYTRMP